MLKLITTGMAARTLGLSQERVRQLIDAGKLPAFRANTIRLVFAEDVEQLRRERAARKAQKARAVK